MSLGFFSSLCIHITLYELNIADKVKEMCAENLFRLHYEKFAEIGVDEMRYQCEWACASTVMALIILYDSTKNRWYQMKKELDFISNVANFLPKTFLFEFINLFFFCLIFTHYKARLFSIVFILFSSGVPDFIIIIFLTP